MRLGVCRNVNRRLKGGSEVEVKNLLPLLKTSGYKAILEDLVEVEVNSIKIFWKCDFLFVSLQKIKNTTGKE